MKTKRDTILAEARELFQCAADAHGLTLRDRDMYGRGPAPENGFELTDTTGAIVLTVTPTGYSWKAPRLEASGPVLPTRKVSRGRFAHSLWRGSAEGLLDACDKYLRPLTWLERFERDRRTFMARFTMPSYRGPKPQHVGISQLHACMIGSYRTGEDIREGHFITEQVKARFESDLSDDLMHWLIDASFTFQEARARAMDEANQPKEKAA